MLRRRMHLVALALLLVGVLGFAWGFLAHSERLFPYSTISGAWHSLRSQPVVDSTLRPVKWRPAMEEQEEGRFRQRRSEGAEPPPSPGSTLEMEELLALGYAGAYHPPRGRSTQEQGAGGLSLYSSGEAAVARLIDRTGRVLHTWSKPFEEVFPALADGHSGFFWTRVRLLPGGDLLAIYRGRGVVRLDRYSQVVWSSPQLVHHDLEVGADGRLYLIGRALRVIPAVHPRQEVIDDLVVVMDLQSGEVLERISIYDAFAQSLYSPLVTLDWLPRGELLHTNTLEYLDPVRPHPIAAFRRGHILLTIRDIDTVAVLDLNRRRIVWAMKGMWTGAHGATLLETGRLLIVDNLRGDNRSAVIEFDPASQEVAWQFEGRPDAPFFTAARGDAQRLPDGNTLISESDRGRAFEVDPDGKLVWEYETPARGGEEGELIATLFEMTRVPADANLSWLGTDDR